MGRQLARFLDDKLKALLDGGGEGSTGNPVKCPVCVVTVSDVGMGNSGEPAELTHLQA